MGIQGKEITLLGQGPSMHSCPFNTETWAALTVLGLEGWEDKPISKAFCFDKPDRKENEARGLVVARRRGIPVIGWAWLCRMGETETEQFVTEHFPLREMFNRFDTHYYKNDATFMIALALMRGYKKLHLYGIDQGGGPKDIELVYIMARPFVMYWLGIATGMGVEWDLGPDCLLLRDGS